MIQRVPTFMPTQGQRDWLEAEKKKTGNAFSVILKGLIQKEINKDEANSTMAFVNMAREDVKAGRVMSSVDFKDKLAKRKETLKGKQND